MNVYWFCPPYIYKNSDGALDSDVASLRYRMLIPQQYIAGKGHKLVIFMDAGAIPAELQESIQHNRNDAIVIISKPLNTSATKDFEFLLSSNVPCVVDICDNHFTSDKHDLYTELCQLADRITVPSNTMAETVKQYSGKSSTIIFDSVEGHRVNVSFKPKSRLRLLWFGHPSNLQQLLSVLDSLNAFSASHPLAITVVTKDVYDFREIIEKKCVDAYKHIIFGFIDWTRSAQEVALANADIVIIPSFDSDSTKAKSANRVVQSLWAGKPVVAYPLPSYMEFQSYITLDKDLVRGIKNTINETGSMKKKVRNGQMYINQNFSSATIGQKWLSLLEEVHNEPLEKESSEH